MAKNWKKRVEGITYPTAKVTEQQKGAVNRFLLSQTGERIAQEILADPEWSCLSSLGIELARHVDELDALGSGHRQLIMIGRGKTLTFEWKNSVPVAVDSKSVPADVEAKAVLTHADGSRVESSPSVAIAWMSQTAPRHTDASIAFGISDLLTGISTKIQERQYTPETAPAHIQELIKILNDPALMDEVQVKFALILKVLYEAIQATRSWISPWSWATYMTRATETQALYNQSLHECLAVFNRLPESDRHKMVADHSLKLDELNAMAVQIPAEASAEAKLGPIVDEAVGVAP